MDSDVKLSDEALAHLVRLPAVTPAGHLTALEAAAGVAFGDAEDADRGRVTWS